LLGRVIYIKDSSTATQIDTAFTQVFVPAGITDHNLLNGLQGGTSDQYYHLSNSDYNYLNELVATKRLKHTPTLLTGSFTASGESDIFFVSGSGNINLYLYGTNTLPSSSVTIKLLSNLNLTIYPSSSEFIEFNTTALINTKGTSIEIFPHNGSWYII
jgi:hypothetical protein